MRAPTEHDALVVQKIRVRSDDGAESDATVFLDGSSAPRALVVCTSAMGVAASYYEGLASELARRGLGVVTAESRGIGSSSVGVRRGIDFGYHELVEHDLAAVIASVRDLYPSARLVLLGHSLGGHVSAMHASLRPGAFAGLVFVAAG